MSRWDVFYTDTASEDMERVHETIVSAQLSYINADRQKDRIETSVRSLSEYALNHPVYPYEPWQTRGVHYMVVDNYLVLYSVNVESRAVFVLRIMYHGQNLLMDLMQGDV